MAKLLDCAFIYFSNLKLRLGFLQNYIVRNYEKIMEVS